MDPVSPYYVPPPGEYNAFNEFWSGYTRTRLPMAQQVFTHRLSQLTPVDNTALIQDLEQKRADYIEGLRKQQSEALKASQSGGDSDKRHEVLKSYLSAVQGMHASDMSASASTQSKAMDVDIKLWESGELPDEVKSKLRRIQQMPDGGSFRSQAEVLINDYAEGMSPAQRATLRSQIGDLAEQRTDLDEQQRGNLIRSVETMLEALPAADRPEARGAYTSARTKAMENEALGMLRDYMANPPGTSSSSAGVGASGGASAPRLDLAADPYLSGLNDRLNELYAGHGKMREVDFAAPLVKRELGRDALERFDKATTEQQMNTMLGAEHASRVGDPKDARYADLVGASYQQNAGYTRSPSGAGYSAMAAPAAPAGGDPVRRDAVLDAIRKRRGGGR